MRRPRHRQRGTRLLKFKSSRSRVVEKHLDRLKRIVVEILAYQIKFFQQLVGDGDDMASDCVSLKNIQELPRTSPNQLRCWGGFKQFQSRRHERNRIQTRISNAARKH